MCRFRRPVLRPETNVSHWITEKRRSDEPRGVGSCWTSHSLPVNSFSYTDVHLSEWFQKNFATTFSKWQRWRAELVFSIIDKLFSKLTSVLFCKQLRYDDSIRWNHVFFTACVIITPIYILYYRRERWKIHFVSEELIERN